MPLICPAAVATSAGPETVAKQRRLLASAGGARHAAGAKGQGAPGGRRVDPASGLAPGSATGTALNANRVLAELNELAQSDPSIRPRARFHFWVCAR